MRWIDEQYLATRFVGRPGDSWALAADDGGVVKLRQTGHQVNRKRVQRLLRMIELETLGLKPKTSQPTARHRV